MLDHIPLVQRPSNATLQGWPWRQAYQKQPTRYCTNDVESNPQKAKQSRAKLPGFVVQHSASSEGLNCWIHKPSNGLSEGQSSPTRKELKGTLHTLVHLASLSSHRRFKEATPPIRRLLCWRFNTPTSLMKTPNLSNGG